MRAHPVKKTLNIMLIVLVMVAVWVMYAHPDWIVGGLPKAGAQSIDKDTAQCTGHETAGHCADKCPGQTDTLLGFDDHGVAICRPAPTGCPYGDSIPLDSPKCTPPSTTVYNAVEPTTPDAGETFTGK